MNKDHRKLNMAVCMVLLLTGMACKNNEQPAAQATVTNARQDSAVAITDTLQAQNSAARSQIDGLMSSNSALNVQLVQKDMEIAKLKKEVGHMGKKNKALQAKLKKDQTFIASLKGELSDKARAFAEKLGLLQNENGYLASERDSFMRQYVAVKELGSVLHVSDFQLEPIHLKRHGRKLKETARARRVDELRVSFDIDENRVADNGVKDLYLVITDPEGKLMNDAANGSGNIKTSTGKTVSYSMLKEINLKKNEPVKDVIVDWKQDGSYKKGNYTITIYNGGYSIGGGTATLI